MDSHDNKLQIRNAGYNDSGSYVCTAANVLGKLQKEVKLFVEGEMKFLVSQIQITKKEAELQTNRR